MTETEKLKQRIEALGYEVIIIDVPNTYHSSKYSREVIEVLIFNGLEPQSWDKSNAGHPHTMISYLHWHDCKPISFFRVRTQKEGNEVEGCLNDFEECIARYSKPPISKQHGQNTRTTN